MPVRKPRLPEPVRDTRVRKKQLTRLTENRDLTLPFASLCLGLHKTRSARLCTQTLLTAHLMRMVVASLACHWLHGPRRSWRMNTCLLVKRYRLLCQARVNHVPSTQHESALDEPCASMIHKACFNASNSSSRSIAFSSADCPSSMHALCSESSSPKALLRAS